MKKFLTLILLCAVAQIAWAQTVVNTDAEIRSAIGENLIDPIFSNVTITNQSASVYAPHCTLVSLYSPKTFANEEPNVVYLGANSTFLQPDGTETVTIGSFRGSVKLSKFYVLYDITGTEVK